MQNQPRSRHDGRPATLAQAILLLVFAALVAAASWGVHLWRMRRGDYPGIGLEHTWYWEVSTWAAFIGLGVWGIATLVRWARSD